MNRENLKKETLELYRKFESDWFPNKNIDTTFDFLYWLDKNGYKIIKEKK